MVDLSRKEPHLLCAKFEPGDKVYIDEELSIAGVVESVIWRRGSDRPKYVVDWMLDGDFTSYTMHEGDLTLVPDS